MSLFGISRRFLLGSGALGGGLLGSLAGLGPARAATHAGHGDGNMTTVGTVDHAANARPTPRVARSANSS